MLELPANGRGQLGSRRVQLLRKKADQMREDLRMRLAGGNRRLERHFALRLGAQKRRQSLQQRLLAQAKRQSFMPGLANRPRAAACRRNRKLLIVDVGRPAFGPGGRTAPVRDLQPDEVRCEVVDRKVGSGSAEGEARLLQLDEIDAGLEAVEALQVDAGSAEQGRPEMPQFLGIGSTKHRKTVQGIDYGIEHGCSTVSFQERLGVSNQAQ